MKFKSDSHFLIGHAHFTAGKPCQDYALSGELVEAAFAVVSDGCSTGGLTDVGSRTIALTSAKAIRGCAELVEKFSPGQITLVRRDGIKQASLILGLKPEDMLATCIYAYVSPQGGFIQLEGDGVIAMKYHNGDIKIYRYDWANNTPFYPAYNENLQGFITAHGDDLQIESLVKQTWISKPREAFIELPLEKVTLENGIRGVTVSLLVSEIHKLEYLAIFTDGVTQVEGIEWKEVVASLLSFKTSEGEFAKRRMNRVVKDAMKNGRGPIDDISYAVIYCKDQTEEQLCQI